MCGIAGVFLRRPEAEAALRARVAAMGRTLAHRGPDGAGEWADAQVGVGLAHRRLAIIDLSPSGAQPMVSSCGRYFVTYNGELYNYRALRDELAACGRPVQGESDTAVLLEAVAQWGMDGALPRLDAMFAVALWDRAERVLWLARDHAGIKPLAWTVLTDGAVLFGSELRALEAAGGWSPALDAESVATYLRLGCIPAPRTVFRDVHKLPPGGVLRIGMDGAPQQRRWFDVLAVAREAAPARLTPAEAEEAVDAALADSVRAQLVADVPVGAFLSGGVDSSSVVAAMARAAPGAAHAFTIGFDDPAYDESADAARIAETVGVRHTVLRATEADALALVEELPRVYDEPFADSSQLPTVLLARLTRGHVTVALSGDGGDELFGGYRRHVLAARLWPSIARVPLPLRRAAARAIGVVPPGWWDAALRPLPRAPRRPGETLHKLASILAARELDTVYARLTTTDGDALPHGDAPDDPLTRFRALDAAGYLHDDVLTKVDRASMSVALEVRVPMLSPAMIRLAFSLPPELLVRADGGKAVLRDALARHVPRALFEREKTGFSFPVGAWLRGPLRGWAGDLLASQRLRESGLIDRGRTARLWTEHGAGRRDHASALWAILMLAAWLEARR